MLHLQAEVGDVEAEVLIASGVRGHAMALRPFLTQLIAFSVLQGQIFAVAAAGSLAVLIFHCNCGFFFFIKPTIPKTLLLNAFFSFHIFSVPWMDAMFVGPLLWMCSIAAWKGCQLCKCQGRDKGKGPGRGYDQLVGRTPLVELSKLSKLLGRRVLVKLEANNPGGTGKDRAVQAMLDEAEASGALRRGMTVFEGSSGSTGIALAFQCLARGYALHVVMPDDQASEKAKLLRQLGATVSITPCCSIANKDHYVNTARRLAQEGRGWFADQFENLANRRAHYTATGPEIWEQAEGRVDAFVMSAGTGGTIAGVSAFLKERHPAVRVVLADPFGSSLAARVQHGVCYATQQAEGRVRKHRYDSIVEGVGLDRVTANFSAALIDEAHTAGDQELLDMAHALLRLEGLFVGSSSALNLAVACKVAAALPRGSTVVTMVCDSGARHLSRFWSQDYITDTAKLRWPQGQGQGQGQGWAEGVVSGYLGSALL